MKNTNNMQDFEKILQDFNVESRISNHKDLLSALEKVSNNKEKNKAFINTVQSTIISGDNDLENKIYLVFSDMQNMNDRLSSETITVKDIESSNKDDVVYFLTEDLKFKFDNLNSTVTAMQIDGKTDNNNENYYSERILSKINYN